MWLAVNKDGQEVCSNARLFKYHDAINELIERFSYGYHRKCLNNDDHWCDNFSEGYYTVPFFTGVILPQGSIEKLIGRKLDWDDGPVEIK